MGLVCLGSEAARCFPLPPSWPGSSRSAPPCCIPLVPGYLSYISALPVAGLAPEDARRVATRAAVLFVGGFSTVFVVFGMAASTLGTLLLRNEKAVNRVFGVVIVALGLSTIGLIRIPILQRERRLDLARIPPGFAWAFPLGMAFAARWAPCIGPVLTTILATASVSASAAWGGFLLGLYSLGLGIPFVLLARGFDRANRSLPVLRRHSRQIEVLGGTLLVTVGALFFTGRSRETRRPRCGPCRAS